MLCRCLQVWSLCDPARSARQDTVSAVTEEDEQLDLECDEAQELLMPLQRESVGDGGAGEPEEHKLLGAGSEGTTWMGSWARRGLRSRAGMAADV